MTEALGSAVGVEAVVAEESDEGLTGGPGELDGEARWGGDGSDEGDAGGEGLLDDFEGDPPRDEKDVLPEGEGTLEGGMADDLVDGVVASDVLAQNLEVSAEVEEGCGMQATGGFEGGLGVPHPFGQGKQPLGSDDEWIVDGRMVLSDGFDGGLATQAAGRNGEDVPGQAGEVDDEIRAELDVEDRAVGVARVAVETGDVGGVAEDAFRDEEAGGEFVVVAGRPERDGDGPGIDADLEGFLDGHLVLTLHPAGP